MLYLLKTFMHILKPYWKNLRYCSLMPFWQHSENIEIKIEVECIVGMSSDNIFKITRIIPILQLIIFDYYVLILYTNTMY